MTKFQIYTLPQRADGSAGAKSFAGALICPSLHILIMVCAVLASADFAHAQSVVDGFNPGANDRVRAVAVQADGKILVGGDFTTLGGGGTGTTTRNHIGRLNADGSLDTSFNPGANGAVYALAVQADGKILVGGVFTGLGGAFDTGFNPRNGIGRLNADGSLDSSFNPGANDWVFALVVQADGKILVGGDFSTLGGASRANIGRLNANGTPDSFNPGANDKIWTVAVQADGKVWVGGDFRFLGGGGPFSGSGRNRIGRLNADGSLDTSVGGNDGTINRVSTLAVQADGKILVGGDFTALGFGGGLIGSATRNHIGRLNANGSLDTSFNPGVNGLHVDALMVQPDGKILVGGFFYGLGGGTGTTTRNHIGRLNGDGSVDASFNPGANSIVEAMAVQADGKILVVGDFTRLGGGGNGTTARNYIGRLTVAPPTAPVITTHPSNQTVSPGATVSFSSEATGSPSPTVQWQVSTDSGSTFADISGATAGTYSFVAATADKGKQFRAVFSNNLGTKESSVAVLAVITLAEALDATNLTWTTGGSAGWSVQTTITHDGVDAAQSGRITHNQESWLQTSVTSGPGALTFWWKVSSDEAGGDELVLSVNGVRQRVISREVDWQQQTINLAAGLQTLRWTYRKDQEDWLFSGRDRAWLDQVSFVPASTPPTILVQPSNVITSAGNSATFSVAATGTAPLSYQWRKDGVNVPGATSAFLTYSNVQTSQAGNYEVVITNAYGSRTSSVAVLTVNAGSQGTVVAWGAGKTSTGPFLEYGQSVVPAGLNGVVTAIAADEYHTVALKSDGTVVAWGGGKTSTGSYPENGQSIVPVGLSEVVAIAAGRFHTVALKNNGTVVAWGSNALGETTVPVGLSGVTAIAADNYYTVALRHDGTLVAWGSNTVGTRAVPANLSGVTAIAAGSGHTVALKNDGTVVAWGDNFYGQTSVPAGLSGVTAITAGRDHTLCLKSDGTVVAWGNNQLGQTTIPAGLSGVTAIAAGAFHTVALVGTGGDAPPVIIAQPNSQAVRAGQNATFAVTATGTAPLSYQWRKDRVNIPGATSGFLPLSNVQVNQAGNYDVVITNAYDSVTSSIASLVVIPPITLAEALDTTDLTWTTGGSAVWTGQTTVTHDGTSAAQSGSITHNQQSWMETTVTGPGRLSFWWKVSSEASYDYLEFYINDVRQSSRISGEVNWQQQTFDLTGASNVLRWRYFKDEATSTGQDHGWVDQVSFVTTPPTITMQPASQTVIVGQNATFTVTAMGTVPLSYQWRKDGVNLPGATSATYHLTAVQANQAGNYTVVVSNSVGSVTSAPPAVLTVNAPPPTTVVAWGDNQLDQTIVPAGLSGVTAIAAGPLQTAALLSDGTVVMWGDNFEGQTSVPAGLSGVTAVAAGFYHTVALKSDGTVVAWGAGNLNTGSFPDFGQSIVPADLSSVIAIAAGGRHTVALKGNGTVVAWGANDHGQRTVPIGLNDVTAIAAGQAHTVALKNNGMVVAWGWNDSGQKTIPAGLSAVTAIAAGWRHTVALKSDGTVMTWGAGNTNTGVSPEFGQSIVPAGLSGVAAIAAGGFHSVALKSDGTIVVWGDNRFGQSTVPAGLRGVTAIAAGWSHTVALFITGVVVGPTVSVLPSGNNLILLWPDSARGYRVESTSSLLPPVTWSSVGGSFQTVGGSISIVLPMTGGQKFYRLVKP